MKAIHYTRLLESRNRVFMNKFLDYNCNKIFFVGTVHL